MVDWSWSLKKAGLQDITSIYITQETLLFLHFVCLSLKNYAAYILPVSALEKVTAPNVSSHSYSKGEQYSLILDILKTYVNMCICKHNGFSCVVNLELISCKPVVTAILDSNSLFESVSEGKSYL